MKASRKIPVLVIHGTLDNVVPMLEAGWDNRELTKYLIEQVRLSPEERCDALRAYFPNARNEDWELAVDWLAELLLTSDFPEPRFDLLRRQALERLSPGATATAIDYQIRH